MDKRTDKSINKFITAVAQQYPDLITVYLFGSYAQEKQNENSDIDIALIIKHLKETDKFDVQVQLMLLAAQFNTRIEPHPLSSEDFYSNNPFASEIKRTGIKIKLQTPNIL